MQIVDFTVEHIPQAMALALANYNEARGHAPALPFVDAVPDLAPYADFGLGATAMEGDRLLGFLCAWRPWVGAWNMPGLRHVYSPMGANGAVKEGRARIYARLYQAAGEKWKAAGALSHGVCVYAHDLETQAQFFRYGFGSRTVDAVRATADPVDAPTCTGYTFAEATPADVLDILPLDNAHMAGYLESPFFMIRRPSGEEEFLAGYDPVKMTYIIARYEGKAVAYIQAELDGETFIQDTPGYLHCKGLYCLPEHRGNGIAQRLLYLLNGKLRAQGIVSLGVDYESINPAGSGFWKKYFQEYVYGVVRRIDGN